MIKLKLMFVLFLLPSFIFSQDVEYSKVKTNSGEIKIPGNWDELNTMNDSGQTYLTNKEGVIIAVAQNPKKAYPFFKSDKSDFENVKEFYKWDSDYYRNEKHFKTEKVKENSELEYVIWKYNDGKLDNVFLFGSSKNNFLNLLVYTNIWSENERVKFLENLYKLNK